MILKKVISGGQTGADQAGLAAAKSYDILTGGFAPKNFMTSSGANATLKYAYGLEEIEGSYKERTRMNVEAADATIRLAIDFDSPGEKCTLNAIKDYNKPYYDVNLLNAPAHTSEVVAWILEGKFEILNIAGNSQY